MFRNSSLLLILIFLSFSVLARIGTINVPEADIYGAPNFDSDIIESIQPSESFRVSKKNYNGFFKIKLKSGKMGYIPDHEVIINGKEFQEKPYINPTAEDELERKRNSKDQKISAFESPRDVDEDEESFDFNLQGLSFQTVNFHEDTMGALQVDDLMAIGYKSLSDTSFEVFASFKAPKYYSEKLNASVQGFHLWTTYGINNTIPLVAHGAVRYGGALMAHVSQVKISAPQKSYDLQDLTAGIVLEAGFLLHYKKAALDFNLKYFFDRNNYGAFGLSLLF